MELPYKMGTKTREATGPLTSFAIYDPAPLRTCCFPAIRKPVAFVSLALRMLQPDFVTLPN